MLLPQSTFDKGTSAKFSKAFHTVTKIVGNSCYYVDNEDTHRYRLYELLVTADPGVAPPSDAGGPEDEDLVVVLSDLTAWYNLKQVTSRCDQLMWRWACGGRKSLSPHASHGPL